MVTKNAPAVLLTLCNLNCKTKNSTVLIVAFELQNKKQHCPNSCFFSTTTNLLLLQSHILTSEDADNLSEELTLPHLPDMLFLHNRLKVWT